MIFNPPTNNKQAGKPVLIGVHYKKEDKFYNYNKGIYHFIVLVGKGYDTEKRKYYYRFYDVNTFDDLKTLSEPNRLYTDRATRFIRGTYDNY